MVIYTLDHDEPVKRARAQALLAHPGPPDLVISTQVLQESYSTATRRFRLSASGEDVEHALRELLDHQVVVVDPALVFRSMESSRRYQIAFWDALIVESALSAGCTRLLSEDFQLGRRFGSLVVENPFVHG